jgi:hypothetical protein
LLPVHVANVEMVRSDSAVRYSANIVPYAQVDLAFKSGATLKYSRVKVRRQVSEHRCGRSGGQRHGSRCSRSAGL